MTIRKARPFFGHEVTHCVRQRGGLETTPVGRKVQFSKGSRDKSWGPKGEMPVLKGSSVLSLQSRGSAPRSPRYATSSGARSLRWSSVAFKRPADAHTTFQSGGLWTSSRYSTKIGTLCADLTTPCTAQWTQLFNTIKNRGQMSSLREL